MKTAEEKAKEYAEEAILSLNSESESMQDFVQKLKKYAKVDFLAGYNEAMRWRTFDEKPIIHSWILVRPKLYPIFKPKVKRVDVFIDLSKKYTHWRPIE